MQLFTFFEYSYPVCNVNGVDFAEVQGKILYVIGLRAKKEVLRKNMISILL